MATPAQKIQRERRMLKGFCSAIVARVESFNSKALTKAEKDNLKVIQQTAEKILVKFDCSSTAANR